MGKKRVQIFYTLTVLGLFVACLYFLNRRTKIEAKTDDLNIRKNMVVENDEARQKLEETKKDKEQWKDADNGKVGVNGTIGQNNTVNTGTNEAEQNNLSTAQNTNQSLIQEPLNDNLTFDQSTGPYGNSFNDKDPKENLDQFLQSMEKMHMDEMKKYLPQGSVTKYSMPGLVSLPGKFNSGFDDSKENEQRYLEKDQVQQFSPEVMKNINHDETKSQELQSSLKNDLGNMIKSFEDIEKRRNGTIDRNSQDDYLSSIQGNTIPILSNMVNSKEDSQNKKTENDEDTQQNPIGPIETDPIRFVDHENKSELNQAQPITENSNKKPEDKKESNAKNPTSIILPITITTSGQKKDSEKQTERTKSADKDNSGNHSSKTMTDDKSVKETKTSPVSSPDNKISTPKDKDHEKLPSESKTPVTILPFDKHETDQNKIHDSLLGNKKNESKPKNKEEKRNILPLPQPFEEKKENKKVESNHSNDVNDKNSTVLHQTIKVSFKPSTDKEKTREQGTETNKNASIKITSSIKGAAKKKKKSKAAEMALNDQHKIESSNSGLLTDNGIIKPENTLAGQGGNIHNLSNVEKISKNYTESTPIFRNPPEATNSNKNNKKSVKKEREVPKKRPEPTNNIVPIIKFKLEDSKEHESHQEKEKSEIKKENVANQNEKEKNSGNKDGDQMVGESAIVPVYREKVPVKVEFLQPRRPVETKLSEPSAFQEDYSSTDSLEAESNEGSYEDSLYDMDRNDIPTSQPTNNKAVN
ncbi:hypothetical protein M153_9450002424 [Pseudoloma neurophilia]|uniref:Uncharacterized protein n=1 Tax=Pseudoloma neurophilia TaxID=146866 RepID=A0A0R0LVF6_9MICR|nr:hypothetical protein M153_9450002424 [Pseudoloma neurophilia]